MKQIEQVIAPAPAKEGSPDKTIRAWRELLGPQFVEELIAEARNDAKQGKHFERQEKK